MVNTTMNPWQWNESIQAIGELFRLNILNCLGKVSKTYYVFIKCSNVVAIKRSVNRMFNLFITVLLLESRKLHFPKESPLLLFSPLLPFLMPSTVLSIFALVILIEQ